MWPFALSLKRAAIGGEKFWFSKEAGRFRNNALVKLEDADKSLHEIFVRRTPADRFR
jgi:hypothetical protein